MIIKYRWYEIAKEFLLNKELAKKVLAFGYPLIGVSIIFCILTYSDRFIIQLFRNITEVGLYSYGYNMGNALFYTLTNAIMLGAYPRIANEWIIKGRAQTERLISEYLNLFMYVMIPATLGIIAVGERAVKNMCGEEYWRSASVFIITCISYTVYGFLQYTNKAWELTKQTKMILKLNIIAAVANFVMNLVFIPFFGYTAAAVTTLISFLIYIVFSLASSRRILTISLDRKVLRNVSVASIVMFFISKTLNYLLPDRLIILGLIVIIAVLSYGVTLLVMKDDNAIQILNRIKNEE